MKQLERLYVAAAPTGPKCRLAALALLATLFAAPARAQDGAPFAVGYNQAWFHTDYGHDLTYSFDPIGIDLVFQKIADAGGAIVRVWIFTGDEKQGVVFTQETRTAGLEPGFLDHVGQVCQKARDHNLVVYFTAFDGNFSWDRPSHASNVHYNILNNRFGEGDSFNSRALGPVLDVLSQNQDVVFALDLMNEVEGSVETWFWPDSWTGARTWMQRTAAFVKQQAPWLRVTASAGWATGPEDLAGGLFSGIGLDFYDVHVYNDDGMIPMAFPLRMRGWSDGRQIILGEFGQSADVVDDDLQTRVTAGFLASARGLGFVAALGWRFDDERPTDPSFVPSLSFLRDGQPRPAVDEMRKAAQAGGWTANPWW